MMFNCDITIFNKYIEDRVTKYQRNVIKSVFWEDSAGVNILQSGLESADRSRLFIPFRSGTNYLKPKDFKQNRQGHFTLQHEDIVVKGIVDDEFTTIKVLENKYDDVRVITTVDTRDFGSKNMQHWEVGAK